MALMPIHERQHDEMPQGEPASAVSAPPRPPPTRPAPAPQRRRPGRPTAS